MPQLMLATLCLNEMEHLPKLYEQHKDWLPNDTHWVFVEAADAVYAKANPHMVSNKGLSVDGTSGYLADLAASDSRITYIPHGFTKHDDPAQGKVAARQRYLDAAEKLAPKFVFVLDADEFYTKKAQKSVWLHMQQAGLRYTGFVFRQRHIWRPPSIADAPLFANEVVGGYWAIPHSRGWRWLRGMRYNKNHNTPEDKYGGRMDRLLRRVDRFRGSPQCIHLGFASTLRARAAKHRYYVARGEGVVDQRQWYCDCRAAFETWRPGDELPHEAKVIPYEGEIPEVFGGVEQPVRGVVS